MTTADENDPENRPSLFAWFLRVVVGFAVAVFALMILLPLVARESGSHHLPSCANGLKQIGLSLKMYANEDREELFPTLSREPGRLMFEVKLMHPEYVPDPMVALCSHDADFERFTEQRREANYAIKLRSGIEATTLIDDWSYFYLGYALRSDEDMEKFAAAYKEHLATGRAMEEDLVIPINSFETYTLYRLRDNIEAKLVQQGKVATIEANAYARMQSEVPIVIERIGNHKNNGTVGANILYLDGHVDFIRYPDRWPMTEKTVALLNELDALGPPSPGSR